MSGVTFQDPYGFLIRIVSVHPVQDFLIAKPLHGNHSPVAAHLPKLFNFFCQTVFQHFVHSCVNAFIEKWAWCVQDKVCQGIGAGMFFLLFIMFGDPGTVLFIKFQGTYHPLDIVLMDIFG